MVRQSYDCYTTIVRSTRDRSKTVVRYTWVYKEVPTSAMSQWSKINFTTLLWHARRPSRSPAIGEETGVGGDRTPDSTPPDVHTSLALFKLDISGHVTDAGDEDGEDDDGDADQGGTFTNKTKYKTLDVEQELASMQPFLRSMTGAGMTTVILRRTVGYCNKKQ